MTADAEITVYEKKDAVVIPKAAVKKEGDKETVTSADGKAISVKTGRSQGDKVEVLEGLKAGDSIRLPEAKPESKPEAKPAPAKEA
jgi:multidrug efflux pump subunit AcrA (membrane-fusion protein)